MRGLALVTGVSSSPGYKTALRLASAGWEVLGVYNQHPVEGVPAVRWDLAEDPRGVVRLYKPSLVVHAAALGWRPKTPWEAGLRMTVEWYVANRWWKPLVDDYVLRDEPW